MSNSRHLSALIPINFNRMDKIELDALIATSNYSLTLIPGQRCDNRYRLPTYFPTSIYDPTIQTRENSTLIHNLHLNDDAIRNGRLTPGRQYLSIREFKDYLNNFIYIAEIITVSQFVPITFINPTDDSDASNKALFDLLNTHKEVNIFHTNKLYPLKNPDNTVMLVALHNNLVKYVSNKKFTDGRVHYAITNKVVGSGRQATAYDCNHTLILGKTSVTIKRKAEAKKRSIKIGNNKSMLITKSETRFCANQEYMMQSKMPSEFHAKHDTRDDIHHTSALVSKYFNGRDLSEILFGVNPTPLSPYQRISLCLKIAKKLQELHAANIIHRDLKPENIIVECEPVTNHIIDVHIIDLGFAIDTIEAAAGVGQYPGTAHYASPESFSAGHMTPASDVFSLGRTFWSIISNKLITRFFSTRIELEIANMPSFQEIFDWCIRDNVHPAYAQSLYYLLAKMNERKIENRIALNAVVTQLEKIQQMANDHFAKLAIDDSSKKAAATTPSNIGLFGTAPFDRRCPNRDAESDNITGPGCVIS